MQSLRPNRPNVPRVDASEVQALRSAHSPDEFGVPASTQWTPGPEDHRKLHRDPSIEIPDFIPLFLDAPQNEVQAQLAKIALEDQANRQTYTKTPHTETPKAQPMPKVSELPDFDPEVDDPDEEFVGLDGLKSSPSVMTDQQGNVVDPRLASKPQQTSQPVKTAQAPMQPQAQPAIKSKKPVHVITEHPVLQKLRERFGLKAQSTKTEVIGGMNFTFRKFTNQAFTKFVTNRVRAACETHSEFEEKFGYALASISIAAIDGVPTHEVFGVDIDEHLERPLLLADPMQPPTSVIVSCAEKLFPWLLSLSIPELGDALSSTYSKLYPEEKLIQDKGIWKFECIKLKCTETQERKPRYDIEGNMKKVYCPIHGTPMRALGSLEDLTNLPLV